MTKRIRNNFFLNVHLKHVSVGAFNKANNCKMTIISPTTLANKLQMNLVTWGF
jgi:hypothetical protein